MLRSACERKLVGGGAPPAGLAVPEPLQNGGCDEGASASAPPCLEEAGLEAMAEYRARMGRWRREVVELCSSATFWVVLEVMRQSHQPLMHHFWVLRSKAYSAATGSGADGALFHLVCGKGDELLSEFDSLFRSQTSDEW